MTNEYRIETLNNIMSLRLPQYKSLEILDNIMQNVNLSSSNEETEKQIHEMYPVFREFERSFPSLTFALATGVGKTILMGAFISYLYLNHGIKNFFIIAPNLTIYHKLIKDFGDPSYDKYVFKRIQPFVQNPPTVITGDTYNQYIAGQTKLKESITINIFNIGKINNDVRGNNVPQVKRLSEYIGESYFDYLASLPDLVVLMDESHHYRADRGMAVINELDPLLGLELTATPQTETSKGAKKFKNVVYEYSLAKAIIDGYVKEPAAATRRDFEPYKYTPDEIDKLKLFDGIRIHRNTKTELETFAKNNPDYLPYKKYTTKDNAANNVVKPFVLVVCKDTTHAGAVEEYLESDEFYDGYYKDKVLIVHSNQKGSEKDENIQKLLSLESPDNKIEIVIHVNMLKEGWDVTNLYTIIPLRTATSLTLREQTLGRGLRLPYGKRTGNKAVDRLTIVAHDKFEEIIDAANEETSIIKQQNVIVIEDDEDLDKEKEVVQTKTIFDDFIEQKEKNLKYARSEEKKQAIEVEIETSRAVGIAINECLNKTENIIVPMEDKKAEGETPAIETIQSMNRINKLIAKDDLQKEEVKEKIKTRAKEILTENKQTSILDDEIDSKINLVMSPLIEQKIASTIEIPDIAMVQRGTQKITFEPFELSNSFWYDLDAPSDKILIESLENNEVEELSDESILALPDSPPNIIIGEILNQEDLIDYEENADLLYSLANQALAFIGKGKDENELNKILMQYKKDIASHIIEAMKEHSKLAKPDFEIKLIRAVSPIAMQTYTKFKEDEVVKYTANIPAYEIKKKVVGEFNKACHTVYKFDSVPEHIFSIVLERDENVVKWLRPAPGQFKIWWKAGCEYRPDFLVETNDKIYIVEIKARNRIQDEEVRLKKEAAITFCNNVNYIFSSTNKKKWDYLLLMDYEIARNMSFKELAKLNYWKNNS